MNMPQPKDSPSPIPPGDANVSLEQVERLAQEYGNRFLLEPAPDHQLPEMGMAAVDAMRLIGEELVLDGIPMRNLATFVTTWMEPEAQRIIAENLYRNFIDHAEYPQTAEIEQRCIRMLAHLFNAPGETTGARTQGSSEAIMLGALSLKWKWRARREAAGKGTDRPNLVFGGDVHVVWEKFCRYFDVEPRIIPLQPDKYTIGPEDVEPHVDENTIGVAAVLGTTFTGHADDIVGINGLLMDLHDKKGLDVPLHVDAASGGFVWPFLYPHSEWDFRLEKVRSINVSGHKFGLVYPGIGWLIFRETSDLPDDLVFTENYLGKTDATFTLNFSTGSAMVLAQYYNFVRFGHGGYRYIMETMQANARQLAELIAGMGSSSWSVQRTRSNCPSSPSSWRRSTTTTNSTSPHSWPPSGDGWCPRTRCRRTPSTSRSCARSSSSPSAIRWSRSWATTSPRPARRWRRRAACTRATAGACTPRPATSRPAPPGPARAPGRPARPRRRRPGTC
jgi:glutamate decarboxylase